MNTNYYSRNLISNPRDLNAWTLVEALELEIEAAELNVARLSRLISENKARLSSLEVDTKKHRRAERLIADSRLQIKTLRSEIADKRARIVRLRKRQPVDLTAAVAIASAFTVALLAVVVL